MRRAMVQVQGVFAELDKGLIVAKLKKGRERTRAINAKDGYTGLDGKGKCEGRKSWAEKDPALAEKAKAYRSQNLSLREIAARLGEQGYKTRTGRPLASATISNLLKAAGWPK